LTGWPQGRRSEDGDDRRDLPPTTPAARQRIDTIREEDQLHAVTDAEGRPIRFFITAGQISDYIAAVAVLGGLPKPEWLLADRGYDADWFQRYVERQGDKALQPRPDVAGQAYQAR
jgi:IS5 family transposase